MPSKEWLDKVSELTEKMIQGPDTSKSDKLYWEGWGRVVREYIDVVSPQAISELIAMAKNTTSTMANLDISRALHFDRTDYVVQATFYEKYSIWKMWHGDVEPIENRIPWADKDETSVVVGYLGTDTIAVMYRWAEIRGSLFVFWEVIGDKADFRLIQDWNKKHFPKTRKMVAAKDFDLCIVEQNERREKHKK